MPAHRLIVGLSLTPEQRQWLAIRAQRDDRSLAWVVRQAIALQMEAEQGSDGIAAPGATGAKHGAAYDHG